MAIDLISGAGIFDKWGKIFGLWKDTRTHQADIDTEIDDIASVYGDSEVGWIANILASKVSIQTSAMAMYSTLQVGAMRTLVEMVNADNPQPDSQVTTLLEELRVQMVGSGSMSAPDDDIDGTSTSTITASADGGNTGNGTTVQKALDSKYKLALQYMRSEDIVCTCTVDAQEGQVIAGRERFRIQGEAAISDVKHPDWPGGSGYSAEITVSDPAFDAGQAPGQNVLTNSAFETFTVTNTPDNWVLVTGAAGTDFLEEGTVKYRGSKSLELVGDGATLHEMKQTFNESGQTLGRLKPETMYTCVYRVSADASLSAGVLKLSVKDGSDNIIDSGSATASTDLTGVSTGGTFDIKTFTFVTPTSLPDGLKFVIEATTAISNTHQCYIDDLILVPLVKLGAPGAPAICIIPGSTPWKRGDKITFTATNGGDNEMGQYLDQFFGLYNSGIIIPFDTAGGETVADALVS